MASVFYADDGSSNLPALTTLLHPACHHHPLACQLACYRFANAKRFRSYRWPQANERTQPDQLQRKALVA